jgi:cysteine synthase
MVAAVRGYRTIFVMPDKMSQEKISALRSLGRQGGHLPHGGRARRPAQLLLRVPPAVGGDPQRHPTPTSITTPPTPRRTTSPPAPEIWEQTNGEFDVFVSGMGTGGTLSGTGKYLKEKNPAIQIVGVDPVGSVYYDFVKHGQVTRAFSLQGRGIGEDFFPTTMNLKILDDCVRVDDRECFMMTRDLVRLEGIYCGGSCGAAVAGAIKWAKARNKKERILVLLPDSAGRYLTKIFNDDWMRENGFLDEDSVGGTVAHILRRKPGRVLTASKTTTVREAIQLLKEHNISQLPVLDEHQRHCGIVSELELTLGEPLSDLNTTTASIPDLPRLVRRRRDDLIDYLASQQSWLSRHLRAGGRRRAPASKGYEYSRTTNPTRTRSRRTSRRSRAAVGPRFSSGLAATNALLDRSSGRPRRRGQRPVRRHVPHLQARLRALRHPLHVRRHHRARAVERAIEPATRTSTSRRRRTRCCDLRHRGDRGDRASAPRRCSSSTTRSRRRTCSSRSNSAPTSCSIR